MFSLCFSGFFKNFDSFIFFFEMIDSSILYLDAEGLFLIYKGTLMRLARAWKI